jgi:hypothetical protein
MGHALTVTSDKRWVFLAPSPRREKKERPKKCDGPKDFYESYILFMGYVLFRFFLAHFGLHKVFQLQYTTGAQSQIYSIVPMRSVLMRPAIFLPWKALPDS